MSSIVRWSTGPPSSQQSDSTNRCVRPGHFLRRFTDAHSGAAVQLPSSQNLAGAEVEQFHESLLPFENAWPPAVGGA